MQHRRKSWPQCLRIPSFLQPLRRPAKATESDMGRKHALNLNRHPTQGGAPLFVVLCRSIELLIHLSYTLVSLLIQPNQLDRGTVFVTCYYYTAESLIISYVSIDCGYQTVSHDTPLSQL